jgi:hypothetical protein
MGHAPGRQVVMPSAVVPTGPLALGPGYLYYAALASTLPANTVAGSVFTDPWPGAWLLLGITDKGSEFDYELSTDKVEAAEYLDPMTVVPTGRKIGMTFSLLTINATNMKRAMNGGSIVTTGSGATALNSFTPPDLGQEVRAMIGWESQDNTERLIGYQCLQVGKLNVARHKGSDKAMLPLEFDFEKPAGSPPYGYWTAGTARG